MKFKEQHINIILEVIRFLIILLLVYAAVSKLVDYENFRVQLGQSPLLTAFAHWVALLVPGSEIVITGMLFIPRLRLYGLYATFLLMVMFTTYIVIILNFSDFIPCSCGGVLEKLGWTEHLIFNLFFVALAGLGVFLVKWQERRTIVNYGLDSQFLVQKPLARQIMVPLAILLGGGILLISILFLMSEEIVHKRNNFTRRFPPHPIQRRHELQLKFNSYYLAGAGEGKVYLGNTTAPLHVMIVDTTLQNTYAIQIEIPSDTTRFRNIKVKVNPPHFYVMDGTVPIIFKGDIRTWKATPILKDEAFFSLAESVSPSSFAFRAHSAQNNENILGLVSPMSENPVQLKPGLLKKQIDGVFDTDGILLFDSKYKKVVYVHYYHNRIIVADTLLNLISENKTIDTITKAQIKVATLGKDKNQKMAAPPLHVNKRAAISDGYLYVNSNVLGKNEPAEIWNNAAIIDVYDVLENTYAFSFYVNDDNDKSLKGFVVSEGNFIGIFDYKLVVYQLRTTPFIKPRANAFNNTTAQ